MKTLTTIFLLVACGCSERRGLPVQFVLPAGYRGVFSVKLDPNGGIPVPITNGQFVVVIPQNGKVSLSSFDCISGRHVVSARYASGSVLPTSYPDTNVSLRVVNFSPEAKTIVYLIGTQKEADEESAKHSN